MATAILAQGATITIENASAVEQTIGGIVSFGFGTGQAADIDVTTLASTAKEYCQGLQDHGDFTIELIKDRTDTGQLELDVAKSAQAVRTIRVTLSSGAIATFDAYVKSVSTEAASDGAVLANATLKVTGDVTWT